eukprot:scaffold91982_cov30-Tisochrysis_lutea.AAC.1
MPHPYAAAPPGSCRLLLPRSHATGRRTAIANWIAAVMSSAKKGSDVVHECQPVAYRSVSIARWK